MAFAHPERIVEQLVLSPGMHIADFGAGAGYLAVAAAEAVGEEGKVYVIDIQQELLTKATHYAKEHHLKSLFFIHADLEAPNGSTLADACVDVVLAVNLLFQVEEPSTVLTEAFRILRKGARLLIVDWKGSFGDLGPRPENLLSEDTARELAEAAGFSYQSELDAGTYHYGLVFKK